MSSSRTSRYPNSRYLTFLPRTDLRGLFIARIATPNIEPSELYVGHGNGCAIGYDLILWGWVPAGAVSINGGSQTRYNGSCADVGQTSI